MPVVWNHQPQVLLPFAWSQFTSSVRAEETDKADSSTGEAAAIVPKSKRVFLAARRGSCQMSWPTLRLPWQTELLRCIREGTLRAWTKTHRQNRGSRVLSLLPNPHRQKQKKTKKRRFD